LSDGVQAVGLARAGAAVWAAGASLLPNWLASRPEQAARGVQTAAGRCQYAREMGAAGEKILDALGYTKNKRAVEIFKRTRIPDVLTEEVVGEVENVRFKALTQQLRDYIAIAEDRVSRFELIVRRETALSRELQKLVDMGRVNLRREIR
jgi:hypothetical protein